MSIILWIDPWTTTTWFAILEKQWNSLSILDYWVFSTTPKVNLKIKLLEIWNDIKELLLKYNPDLVVIEKLFFQTNLKTGIDVAQARGVILYEAMKHDIPTLEYTPLQVKKAITSNWQAKKAQLQNAIKMIFRLESIPKPDDAADAIWLAYMWALNFNAILQK